MTSAQVCILISIAVYLIAMLAIGIVCSKRNNTVDDFYLGGRRLGPVVTAMSAEASDMSSWLLMGLPGVAYLTGIADPGWTAIGLGVGTYINWLVVARRLRRYSARIGAITVPDFFSRRFGEKKHILTAMAAILIIVFFVPYTASGFAACGKLFGTLFGMDYHVAMIISAIVIVGYTATGGFTAASTTDLVQSVVMSIALVVVLVFGVSKAGGVGAVVENAQSMSGYLSMTATYDPESGKSATYNLLKILSTAAWGLGYFGMPHILLRFMAIEDDRKLKTSRRIATIWVVISMFIAVVIGVVGSAMVKNGAMGALADKETIIVQIANLLSQHGVVAALLAGVILAGILASTMSTADSQLLVASSSFTADLYKPFFRKNATEKETLMVGRVLVLVLSAIAFFIANSKGSGAQAIMDMVENAWGAFGASFGPTILLSLFWRRFNYKGAVAGVVSGFVVDLGWLLTGLTASTGVFEIVPGFIASLIVAVVVTKLTPVPNAEAVEIFDKATSKDAD